MPLSETSVGAIHISRRVCDVSNCNYSVIDISNCNYTLCDIFMAITENFEMVS